MTRTFRGSFARSAPSPAHPLLSSTGRPILSTNVLIGRARVRQSFMIDTGADYTIVQPDAALPLLSAAGIEVAPETSSDDVVLSGVGPAPLTCAVQSAGLSFIDELGNELILTVAVLVPRPSSANRPTANRARTPSLLGRDVLSRFDLHISYDPPNVALTLND